MADSRTVVVLSNEDEKYFMRHGGTPAALETAGHN
jgi:hypothetical protein